MNTELTAARSFVLPIRTQPIHPCRYLCLIALATAAAIPSFAATNSILVTSTGDSGPGTLRQAIATATSGATINFNLQLPATITLASTLSICNLQNLTISGPGASSQVAISGNSAVQVFSICGGASVTISGVTLENGNANDSAGGAIFNLGNVTLTNSTLSANSGGGGGGIYNIGTLTLSNSTLTKNSAAAGGSGGEGGGLFNQGTAILTNTTLFANSAENGGGGVYNQGTLTLINSTVAGNSSSTQGGGIETSLATLTLKSTLLAGNAAGGNCSLGSGNTLTSLGYNLSDDSTCEGVLTQTTDENNTPVQLDPKGLQNNGGPTQTIALLPPPNPAVDAIPVADCTDTNGNPVTTDQRGVTRPQGKACDIGAYELIQTVPFPSFYPSLAIDDGRHPGFVLTSTFTLGSASTGLNLATEAMTLQIANYTLTLPAGSFHKLWNAANAPYGYHGTANGATLALVLTPLGKNTFSFDGAGAPVTFAGIKNPITVTLSFGTDTGTTSVQALITSF